MVVRAITLPFLVLSFGLVVRAQTPPTNWVFATGGAIGSSPAMGPDGTVYIGSDDGKLYAVNPDGSKKWEYKTGGAVQAPPAIGRDGSIYVGSNDKTFYALNPDGTKRWSFATQGQIGGCAAIDAANTIYIGSQDGNIYALGPNGQSRWTFTTGGGVYASPAIGADGSLYIGSYDGRFYAIRENGTTNWSFLTGNAIYASAAIGPDETIVVASLDKTLYALKADGTKLWQFTTGAPIYSSPVIGPDNTIYVGSTDTKFYAIRPDGTQKWVVTTGYSILYSTASVAANNSIYVGSFNSSLLAFSPGGTTNWTFATGAPVVSSPLIGPDGSVYVGCRDAKLYCLPGTNLLARSAWPMFQRDVRHTASSFVARGLPAGYSPGRQMYVFLAVTPPVATAVYAVEDQPPVGWTFNGASDGGSFDATNRAVKFGPFFDQQPRILSYQVTPPQGQTGLQQFQGTGNADGVADAVGGQASIGFVPLHPADINPTDSAISITELASYGAAWRSGTVWPIGPNPIPIEYVTKAVSLWQHGEYYQYESNVFVAPLWWVNSTSAPTEPYPAVPATNVVATLNNTASVVMSPLYRVGQPVSVALSLTPDPGVVVYAVEDQPPAQWGVTNVTGGGFYDPLQQKIKWGPFFDSTPRALGYLAIPPANASGEVTFVGTASFNGVNQPFDGQRRATDRPVPPLLSIAAQTNGFTIDMQLEVGFNYEIQTSPDLVTWTLLTNIFTTNSLVEILDDDTTNYTQRFYRAVPP